MINDTLRVKPSVPKEFHFIGKCPVKGCKSIHRFTVPGKTETRGTRYRYQVTVADWRYLPYIECVTHHRKIGFSQVEGRVTDHVCDARCTGATGHVCECSCGGKNHGKDFSV